MRKLIIIISMIASVSAAVYAREANRPETEASREMNEPQAEASQEAERTGPQMTLEKTVHDFGGMVYKGEPRSVEFAFTNTGDAPLVIIRTENSCTCLDAKYPRKPLAPGESGVIKVTYSPTKETGKFQNTVKVITNTEIKTYTLFLDVTVVKK